MKRGRAYRAAKASEFPSARTAWKGMGSRRFCSPAVRPSQILLQLAILATLTNTAISECRIVRCTENYSDIVDYGEITTAEHCEALRIYRDCATETGRACRGNLNYHSVITLIPDLMNRHNCSHQPAPTTPDKNGKPGRGEKQPAPPVVTECTSYNGRRTYKHCSLFGDPHLRTFDDHFETCKVQGAWPLIDNDFIAVQVTNVPLVEGSSATATDKLTVIIKDHSECVEEQRLYQAQTGNLPAAFVDGTSKIGPGKSLRVLEVVPGEHVEIHAKYIATKIIVRQIGRYLTFAIRMPSDLVNTGKKDGLELCVKGCPNLEKIQDTTSGIVMSKELAVAKCSEVNLTGFYLDSCVFDLITTGDVNFTLSAKNALKDFQTLRPNASVKPSENDRWVQGTLPNTTEEIVYSRAPPRTTNHWTLAISMLFVQCTILLTNWRTNPFVA